MLEGEPVGRYEIMTLFHVISLNLCYLATAIVDSVHCTCRSHM